MQDQDPHIIVITPNQKRLFELARPERQCGGCNHLHGLGEGIYLCVLRSETEKAMGVGRQLFRYATDAACDSYKKIDD